MSHVVSQLNALILPSTGGTCAQRVAARLIPRFAHRFPQKLEQAAAALITITGSHSSVKDPDSVRALSKVQQSAHVPCMVAGLVSPLGWSLRRLLLLEVCLPCGEAAERAASVHEHASETQAARSEALHGLAKVCEAASGVASSAGGAIVTKAAEVLLRCNATLILPLHVDSQVSERSILSPSTSKLVCESTMCGVADPQALLCRRASSEVNGRTSMPAAASTSEPMCALQSLQAAFRSSTRVIVATSLQVGLEQCILWLCRCCASMQH